MPAPAIVSRPDVAVSSVPPEDQEQKQHATHATGGQADGDFKRVDNEAAQNVASQQQAGTAQRHNGQGTAQVVAIAQRHQIGDDQTNKGNGPYGNDSGRDGNRDQYQTQGYGGGIVQAQAGGHAFAHAQNGKAMRVQIGEQHNGQNQINDLVIALHDLGEVAQHPALHTLQNLVLIGIKLGNRAEHAAVHQTNHRHQHGVLEANAAYHSDED